MFSYIQYAILPIVTIVIIACIIERRRVYARYAIGDSYACQATATAERIIAYARYAISDCYACQATAKIERPIAYDRYAIRNIKMCRCFSYSILYKFFSVLCI